MPDPKLEALAPYALVLVGFAFYAVYYFFFFIT
jgi:hypothetical protein